MSRQQLLNEALIVSQQMTAAAEAGEWQQVITLETERSGLLNQAFAAASPANEQTARQIHAILDCDKRLMSLGVTARDEAAVEISQMQRGQKVKQAYRSAGA